MKKVAAILGMVVLALGACKKNEVPLIRPTSNFYNISTDSLICGFGPAYLETITIRPDNQILNTDSAKWYSRDFVLLLSSETELDTIFSDTGSFWMINFGPLQIDTFLINVTGCNFFVLTPDFFTPNSDGINDVWRPLISSFISNVEWRVMDLEGSTIFESTGNHYDDYWDGMINGNPGPEGNYMFWVKYDTPYEEGVTRTGVFELRR